MGPFTVKAVSKRDLSLLLSISSDLVSRRLAAAGVEPIDSTVGRASQRYASDVAIEAILNQDSSGSRKYNAAAEKARYEHHKANNEEIKERRARGDLIEKTAALKHWERMVYAAKSKLLSMPSTTAPAIHSLQSEADVERYMRDYITDALNEISGDPIPAVKDVESATELVD